MFKLIGKLSSGSVAAIEFTADNAAKGVTRTVSIVGRIATDFETGALDPLDSAARVASVTAKQWESDVMDNLERANAIRKAERELELATAELKLKTQLQKLAHREKALEDKKD